MGLRLAVGSFIIGAMLLVFSIVMGADSEGKEEKIYMYIFSTGGCIFFFGIISGILLWIINV